jgi:uncharacterized protein
MQRISAIAGEIWGTVEAMAPYLLLGFAAAGALAVLLPPRTVERHLGRPGWGALFKASLLGVPLPLCSCSVIPVAASLRRHGASRGATAAFLLSTPQTGVDSLAVTYSLLGPVFLVLRPVIAFITGLAGGGLVDALERRAPKAPAPVNACDAECCAPEQAGGRFARAVRHGFVTLPRDMALPMVIGLVVAGVIAALVPDAFFAHVLGGGAPAVAMMMAAGIPIYVCATASVPIAAALIAKGVSPGAALAFLITGPATNAATLTTMWAILGKRATLVVLATVAGAAFASGLMLDLLDSTAGWSTAAESHTLLPGPVRTASAIALLLILGAACLPRRGAAHGAATKGSAE